MGRAGWALGEELASRPPTPQRTPKGMQKQCLTEELNSYFRLDLIPT